MNERINVKEITEGEGTEYKNPCGAFPADMTAALRAKELADAIANYANSIDQTERETDRHITYAEELIDQLKLMKKYGRQTPKWISGGYR